MMSETTQFAPLVDRSSTALVRQDGMRPLHFAAQSGSEEAVLRRKIYGFGGLPKV